VQPPEDLRGVFGGDRPQRGLGQLPLEPNVSPQLMRLAVEQAGVYRPSERPFAAYPGDFGVGCEDVVDGSRVDELPGIGVELGDVFAGEPRPRPRRRAQRDGAFPRFDPIVIPFLKRAESPLLAPVADGGLRFGEPRASPGSRVLDDGAFDELAVDGGQAVAYLFGDGPRAIAFGEAPLDPHPGLVVQFLHVRHFSLPPSLGELVRGFQHKR